MHFQLTPTLFDFPGTSDIREHPEGDDPNLRWAASTGAMKGPSLRMRYDIVDQHGGDS
ncbi:MAG: hypothetical protein V4584_09755 [Verrucomicrobiota bacterium]